MIPVLLLLVLIVRSLIPVAGVLFFHGDPVRVLLLCFTDTLLSLAALIVPMTGSWTTIPEARKFAPRWRARLGAFVGSLIAVAVMGIFLGFPLVFMLLPADVYLWFTVTDPQFELAVALQTVAAVCTGVLLARQLRTRTPDAVGVKQGFGLILGRWFLLIVVTYTGVPSLLGRGGPYLLVILYAGGVIASELNPRGFLQLFWSGRPTAPKAPKTRRLPD